MDRRRRYFDGINARYARLFRVEGLELLERAEAGGATLATDDADDVDDMWRRRVVKLPGSEIPELVQIYEELAAQLEAIPLRRRVGKHPRPQS